VADTVLSEYLNIKAEFLPNLYEKCWGGGGQPLYNQLIVKCVVYSYFSEN
jgi:hypothetical protein